MAFPRDRIYSKSLVYSVYLLETLQTILLLHDGYIMYSARSAGVTTNLLDDLPRYLSERAAPFVGGLGKSVHSLFSNVNRLKTLMSSQFHGADLLCTSP